jgi:hypothetical protein
MILHKDAQRAILRMNDSSHVLAFLKKLECYPATLGDHYELDHMGKPIHFKVLKRHILIYYRDPFADETRILDLLHAEQSFQ